MNKNKNNQILETDQAETSADDQPRHISGDHSSTKEGVSWFAFVHPNQTPTVRDLNPDACLDLGDVSDTIALYGYLALRPSFEKPQTTRPEPSPPEGSGFSQLGWDILLETTPEWVKEAEFKAFLEEECDLSDVDRTAGLWRDEGSKEHRIYILDSYCQDFTMETARHEMLHEVYSRLTQPEREEVNKLLESYIENNPEAAEELLKPYKDESHQDRINELHSILGASVVEIGPDLEEHYEPFFVDRKDTVQNNSYWEFINMGDRFLAREKTKLQTKEMKLLILTQAESEKADKLNNLTNRSQHNVLFRILNAFKIEKLTREYFQLQAERESAEEDYQQHLQELNLIESDYDNILTRRCHLLTYTNAEIDPVSAHFEEYNKHDRWPYTESPPFIKLELV